MSTYHLLIELMRDHPRGADFLTLHNELNIIRRTRREQTASILSAYRASSCTAARLCGTSKRKTSASPSPKKRVPICWGEAMHRQMSLLRDLQAIDSYIDRLRQELKQLDSGERIRAKLEQSRQRMEDIKARYKESYAIATEQERRLQEFDERIRRAEADLYSDASPTRANCN
jgi:hypothetical protein